MKLSPYAVLQSNSDFKVGDKVKVIRNWNFGEMGFGIGQGRIHVGQTGVITSIGSESIQIELEDGWGLVPFFVLEKVVEPIKPTKKPKLSELQKAYLQLQEESGIKTGDYVKVLRSGTDAVHMGWDNQWVAGMDSVIGEIRRVMNVTPRGVALVLSDDDKTVYDFPFHVLEKVQKPFENVKVLDDEGNMIATIYEDKIQCAAVLSYSELRKIAREVAKVAKR